MKTSHLTTMHGLELHRRIELTYPGQAHWAGSGPANTTCSGCSFFGVERERRLRHGGVTQVTLPHCAKYLELMGSLGPPIPRTAASCRHYAE